MLVGDTELWFGGRRPGYWEELGKRWDQCIMVRVDDVDAMYERVKAAGVEAAPPKDETYDVLSLPVEDPEGYHWSFIRRLGTGYIQTTPVEAGALEEVRPS